jgi:glutamate formiminotransferase / formiminotetrahydrofolate cyclodeaminase
LKRKLADPRWKPDFGPAAFNERSGATAVGARNFLVAFNVNLNTTSVRRANAIAYDIREKGRPLREGGSADSKFVTDENGNQVMIPGSLKSVKAIGWFIKEYGVAQISMNLTNIAVTPVHVAFDEVCRKADARGIRVTGSELIGLIPLKAMLDAGKYYLRKQKRSAGVSDEELIRIAVKSMGMNELHEFNPDEKIIEYVMEEKDKVQLIDMNLKSFMDETASESPAPGGGSVSAYMGALGVALGTMVANLSAHKRGWDEKWEKFSDWAEKGKEIQNRLLSLVDEDTEAFKRLPEAFALSGKSDTDKKTRSKAIQDATKNAIIVPFKTMETAFSGFQLIREMVEKGNPNSVTDAGVGALALGACIRGAFLNIKINASALDDEVFAREIILKGHEIETKAIDEEEAVLKLVESKIRK